MKLTTKTLLLSSLLVIGACQAAPLQTIATSEKTNDSQIVQGFSKKRLARIDDMMQRYITSDKLAGTLSLVARNGEIVHLSANGMRDREAQTPMSEDTIFRIYSMTKPITAVAALTLWEQGLFHMNDPIEKHLPELKNLKVYVSGEGDDMVLEDAKSSVTVKQLFLHTAGFSYGFSQSPVDKLYQAAFAELNNASSAAALEKLSTLPLVHQPGAKWHYGVNTDIIGFLVERLTGKKLGEYMQEAIFTPLNMSDTSFYVAAEKQSRLAQIYGPGDKGQTVVNANPMLGDFASDPVVHNGGGGLTSTIGDYFKFTQMLLNGGELNGARILGRKTVQYLSSNHLPDNLIPFAPGANGEGYGLAMSVTVDENAVSFMSSTGNYGWGGAASTYFRIDPHENMIMISMTQFLPMGFHPYHDDFRNVVYQALVD
ncbi:serine hydrolase domain-containing protein [Agaribacter marinus]|uniref:Serine hydrolase n=1 Tax=Agaribacter marinus TaxID=1431249 RepID=A0AA37T1S4_9ALTE|nr:serine hydrolase [Agaribacter marinus]